MSWASDQFETTSLGDARLDERARAVGRAPGSQPAHKHPARLLRLGWAEVQAAYWIVKNASVGFWQIIEPQVRCTVHQIAAPPVALCLPDTDTFDFRAQDIDGPGPLQCEPQRGLVLFPTCVVTPGPKPLGPVGYWHWAR